MDKETLTFIGILVASIPGIISVIKQFRNDRVALKKTQEEALKIKEEADKIKAESDEINVNTALSLVAPLKQRILELECELKKVTEELKVIEALLDEKDKRIKELEQKERNHLDTISGLVRQIEQLKLELRVCKECKKENIPPN